MQCICCCFIEVGCEQVRMNSGLHEQFKPDQFYYSINYYSMSELCHQCLHRAVHPLHCMVNTAMMVDVPSSLSALKFEFQEPTVPNQHQPQAVHPVLRSQFSSLKLGSEYAEGKETCLQVATTAQHVLECSMSSLSGNPCLRFENFLQHWSFSASKAPLVLIQCYYLVTSVLNLNKLTGHVNQDFHVNATCLEHLTQQTTYHAISGGINVTLCRDIGRLLSNTISFPLTQTSFTPSLNLSL